jgi:hypothetical protein
MKFEDMPGDVQFIVGSVAIENDMAVEDMLDRTGRLRERVYARFEAMARIRELCFIDERGQVKNRYSLVAIGKFFGADHTTVINALKRRAAAGRQLQMRLAMMETPKEVLKSDRALKAAVVRERLVKRRDQWIKDREQKALLRPVAEEPTPTAQEIADAWHVEACLKQGGFCHFSEREVRMGNGGRDMQVCLPVVWPIAAIAAL